MPRFIVPYEGLNAPSHSFIISITMTFYLLYKIKMTIKVRPHYSWNYSNIKNKSKLLALLLVALLNRINMREGLGLQHQSDKSPGSEYGAT